MIPCRGDKLLFLNIDSKFAESVWRNLFSFRTVVQYMSGNRGNHWGDLKAADSLIHLWTCEVIFIARIQLTPFHTWTYFYDINKTLKQIFRGNTLSHISYANINRYFLVRELHSSTTYPKLYINLPLPRFWVHWYIFEFLGTYVK